MLKNYPKLFTEDLFSEKNKEDKTNPKKVNAKKLSNFSYDTLDINDFETVINSYEAKDFYGKIRLINFSLYLPGILYTCSQFTFLIIMK